MHFCSTILSSDQGNGERVHCHELAIFATSDQNAAIIQRLDDNQRQFSSIAVRHGSSVGGKDFLDASRILRLGQRKREQNARLLRRQIVGIEEARIDDFARGEGAARACA